MYAVPDQEEMEEATDAFLGRMEQEETRGSKNLHSILSKLPMPTPAPGRTLTVTVDQAIESGFLPKHDHEMVDRFTSSEPLLYRHAQECRKSQEIVSSCYPQNILGCLMLS